MAKTNAVSVRPDPIKKKSSSSANPHQVKTASMNKSKRRDYKAYRGQGR